MLWRHLKVKDSVLTKVARTTPIALVSLLDADSTWVSLCSRTHTHTHTHTHTLTQTFVAPLKLKDNVWEKNIP